MKKMNRRGLLRAGGAVAMSAASASAQGNSPDCACTRGSDGSPLDTGTSELRPMIERFFVELRDLQRVYPMAGSSTRHARLEKFYSEQLRLVESVNFDSLSQAGRVDYLLLRGRVLHEQKNLASDSRKEEDIAPLMPF